MVRPLDYAYAFPKTYTGFQYTSLLKSISAHMAAIDRKPAVCFDPRDVLQDRSRVRMRIVCIPQAGMGAWAFHGWQRNFPPEVEILPVEIPGRNSRMLEPKPTSMQELVRVVFDGLVEYGAFTKPYVLFGHSLGALVAFELLAEALRQGHRTPSLFIASGARPPCLSALEHDADSQQPAISKLPDAEFWQSFESRYGRNPDLALPMVQNMVLPLLRADFGILEAYAPTREAEPLPCPVVACCAQGDNRLKPGQLGAWAAYAHDGAFREHMFKTAPLPWSTPHRYVVESPAILQQFLVAECRSLLSAPKPPSPAPTTDKTTEVHALPPTPPPPPTGIAPSDQTIVPTVMAATVPPAATDGMAAPLSTADAVAAPPPAAAIITYRMSPAEILADAKCDSARASLVDGCTMAEWMRMLEEQGRPAFLKSLASLGFEKLAERQAIANAVSRAKREGRL